MKAVKRRRNDGYYSGEAKKALILLDILR